MLSMQCRKHIRVEDNKKRYKYVPVICDENDSK